MPFAILGMEAIWRIEVEDFPAFIVIDDKGNDFFKELNFGMMLSPLPASGERDFIVGTPDRPRRPRAASSRANSIRRGRAPTDRSC